tara:strand:- start:36029 stop:36283 length:255 start_codon:yes stop_codon:yes gene_type:complete
MDEKTPQHRMDLPADVAAKLVNRVDIERDKDGTPTGEEFAVEVTPAEVLSNTVRGDVITVITTDGQKLVGKAPKGKPAKAQGGE